MVALPKQPLPLCVCVYMCMRVTRERFKGVRLYSFSEGECTFCYKLSSSPICWGDLRNFSQRLDDNAAGWSSSRA